MLLLTASLAMASTPPLEELQQARSSATSLQGTGDIRAKAALGAAAAYLGVATTASLWVDESDAVPPPEGEAVYTNSSTANKELKRILTDQTVSSAAVLAIEDEISEAQSNLAHIALEEVQGSTSAPGAAVSKWKKAFSTLSKQITRATATVPQSTVEQAASNYLANEEHELDAIPQPITGPPLTLEGKPELFYFGAEGCPFCAVQRWSMVVALAEFGKFSTLPVSVSSPIDFDHSTHTLTFYSSHYKSSYLAFVPVEGYTNQPGEPTCNGEPSFPWTILQTPTAAEQELISAYDGYEGCPYGIPFLDVANTWSTIGSYPDPGVIAGLSWQQIDGALSNPASVAGQALDAGAETVTAQICEVDGGQPTRVCNSTVVRRFEEEIKTEFRASFPPP